MSTLASVGGARELAALPNGDLLVGTTGNSIVLVPGADGAGGAGSPRTFASVNDSPAEGIAFVGGAGGGTVYVASQHGLWSIPYHTGDQTAASVTQIGSVRTGAVSPGTDGDIHRSSSVAATATSVFVGVGSSCNRCVETDPTRASIQRFAPAGGASTTLATRMRNPIALAINPATGVLWAGGAGQDSLPYTHPYEYMDAVTLNAGSPVDYGWPQCEENHVPYNALGTSPAPNCSNTVQPRVEFPAYATHIGATFYPSSQAGAYAFPAQFRGGLFVSSHGSWHCCPSTDPAVRFVPMNGDTPAAPVNWSDPTAQWQRFLYAPSDSTQSSQSYLARFSGVAVGPNGSLFVGDDGNGKVYRIRPH